MWNNFDFNEPFDGVIPETICNVKLPIEYIEFMKKHNGGEGEDYKNGERIYH